MLLIVKRSLPPNVVHIVANGNNVGALTTHCIGIVSSVYCLGMGMPCIGLLNLHLQEWIDLELDIVTPDRLNLLDEYWHTWIVFYFHLKFKAYEHSLVLLSN